MVTAEEARFVFSEAVKKFLSQPIRQTSVLVDAIVARLPDPNFFPSSKMPDIGLVVDQETENLDQVAIPELLAKLATVHGGTDPIASANAMRFVLALAERKDAITRSSIVKKFVQPKSSNDAHAEAITSLITIDPQLLPALTPADRMRVSALLLKNAETAGKISLYQELRNPAQALASMITVLGESNVLADYNSLVDWVFENASTAPNFILTLGSALAPILLAKLQEQYRTRASSSDFTTANRFAGILPSLDTALAQVSTEEEALRMLASVVRAAGYNAYGARDLANNKFSNLPELKKKAEALYENDAAAVDPVLQLSGCGCGAEAFGKTYLEIP